MNENEITALRAEVQGQKNVNKLLASQVEAQRCEVERLTAALEWYASAPRYHIRPPFDRSDIDADYGIRARAALKEKKADG